MTARPITHSLRAQRPRLAPAAMLAVATLMLVWLLAPRDTSATRPGQGTSGNAVTRWNTIATSAFAPTEGTNPMLQSRTLSILHAAMHDALNAIQPRFEPYTTGIARAPGTSEDAAVAAAAHEVLTALLPDQASLVQSAYEVALSAVPDGEAKMAGIAVGQAAARANIARRRGDRHESASQPAYEPRPGAGEYQFTPPFDFAAQPGWGEVTPFVIALDGHALEGPQPLSTVEYARDLEYVQAIGSAHSTTRTAEQSEIARFWYEDSPLGWNRIANTAIRRARLDPWSAARTLALVNFAMADGFIAGFEAKYRFRFWRPETAIRLADTDGNPQTVPDPEWRPFLITPPVPDYPSTHTVLGWAAAQVLIELFGDRVHYEAESLTLPGVRRQFQGFSAAAEENGLSRLYAGIHFRHAVHDGTRLGRSIGQAVAAALPPMD